MRWLLLYLAVMNLGAQTAPPLRMDLLGRTSVADLGKGVVWLTHVGRNGSVLVGAPPQAGLWHLDPKGVLRELTDGPGQGPRQSITLFGADVDDQGRILTLSLSPGKRIIFEQGPEGWRGEQEERLAGIPPGECAFWGLGGQWLLVGGASNGPEHGADTPVLQLMEGPRPLKTLLTYAGLLAPLVPRDEVRDFLYFNKAGHPNIMCARSGHFFYLAWNLSPEILAFDLERGTRRVLDERGPQWARFQISPELEALREKDPRRFFRGVMEHNVTLVQLHAGPDHLLVEWRIPGPGEANSEWVCLDGLGKVLGNSTFAPRKGDELVSAAYEGSKRILHLLRENGEEGWTLERYRVSWPGAPFLP